MGPGIGLAVNNVKLASGRLRQYFTYGDGIGFHYPIILEQRKGLRPIETEI